LRYYVPVLEKLDKIISAAVAELPHSPTYCDDNPLVIATLKYLAYTLKNSVFRRYFLSLEVVYFNFILSLYLIYIMQSIGQLMHSMNLEIVHLASEILFYFSMPALSVSSYSSDLGWRDNTEVRRVS
jgi:hypothetical protein